MFIFERIFASNHRIVAGEHSLSQQSGLEQVRTVATYYIHGSYGALTFRNDIALVFVMILYIYLIYSIINVTNI